MAGRYVRCRGLEQKIGMTGEAPAAKVVLPGPEARRFARWGATLPSVERECIRTFVGALAYNLNRRGIAVGF